MPSALRRTQPSVSFLVGWYIHVIKTFLYLYVKAPATLPPGKEPLVLTSYEAFSAPQAGMCRLMYLIYDRKQCWAPGNMEMNL
jgi:hypothetical protein